ncbi:hypothetical protein [Myxococcus sp. Y35]
MRAFTDAVMTNFTPGALYETYDGKLRRGLAAGASGLRGAVSR